MNKASKINNISGADKSSLFLILILVMVVITALLIMTNIKVDSVSEALGQDSVYKVLFVIEDEGKPVSISVLAYYPETHRAAMFDIPGDLGQIIKTLDKVDRLDVLYQSEKIYEFKSEIERLLSVPIPFFITMDLKGFAEVTDLISGIPVFIPEPINLTTEEGLRVLLPMGAVRLDGEKAITYLKYDDSSEYNSTVIARRQNAVMGFFQALNEYSETIFSPAYYDRMVSKMNSNITQEDLKKLLIPLTKLDMERMTPIRVTGSYRDVQGQKLMFPERDGATFREIVRQNFAALASTGDIDYERIYAIEILNGTETQDLARNTGSIYQSFGFDVVKMANASELAKETYIIDHIEKRSMAKVLADLIHCKKIISDEIRDIPDEDYSLVYNVDFTIVLGSDFNGRYVID